MFGTKIADEFFPVHTGGDVAFVNGVLKQLLAIGGLDREFVTANTRRVRRAARGARGRVVRRARAGVGRDARRHGALRARCTRRRGRAVLVWSMGITQHEHGVDNVHAIVNLGLARGNVGRAGRGLMPIRGHSGVQGGAEMGCYATAFPGGVADRPRRPRAALGGAVGLRRARPSRGSPRPRWSTRARRGDARRAVVERRQLPRRAARARRHARRARAHAAARPPGHPRDAPDARRPGRDRRAAAGRDALRAGGRRHVDHDRAAGRVQPRDPGPARRRGAQRVADLRRRRAPGAARARADGSAARPADAIRAEIARVVPALRRASSSCARPATRSRSAARGCARAARFPTPDGKAHFAVVAPHAADVPEGRFVLSTRRGKQFNSMVWAERRPAHRRGARRAVRRRRRRGRARRRATATPVLVRSAARRDARARAPRADPARQRAGVLPRGEPVALADACASRMSGVPDYNAVVEVVPVR